MADGDPVAHDHRIEIALAVEDGAVLDVGVGADADGVHVAAQHGVHPHRGALAERHVADELRGKIDVATGGNLGQPPLVAADHVVRNLRGKLGMARSIASVKRSGARKRPNRGNIRRKRFYARFGTNRERISMDRRLRFYARIQCLQYHKEAPWQVWRWDSLAEVRVQEGEPLENALRRFKRKVQQEDIIKEVKRHSYYLKPGEKKRVKAALARKRNRKKARKEAD